MKTPETRLASPIFPDAPLAQQPAEEPASDADAPSAGPHAVADSQTADDEAVFPTDAPPAAQLLRGYPSEPLPSPPSRAEAVRRGGAESSGGAAAHASEPTRFAPAGVAVPTGIIFEGLAQLGFEPPPPCAPPAARTRMRLHAHSPPSASSASAHQQLRAGRASKRTAKGDAAATSKDAAHDRALSSAKALLASCPALPRPRADGPASHLNSLIALAMREASAAEAKAHALKILHARLRESTSAAPPPAPSDAPLSPLSPLGALFGRSPAQAAVRRG